MKEVYTPFKAPIIVTDINSAELIKHAANSFLALKISYINAIANICEAAGANVQEVAHGIGLDERIGRRFLNAGIGFGGSCFPKDLSAFIKISEQVGYEFKLLKEVQRINADQMDRFVKKITDTLWVLKDKKIGVLGLAFKQNTDDVRSSPAIDLCQRLLKDGATLRVHDPKGDGQGEGAVAERDLRGRHERRGRRLRRAGGGDGMGRVQAARSGPRQKRADASDPVRRPQSLRPGGNGKARLDLQERGKVISIYDCRMTIEKQSGDAAWLKSEIGN